MEQQQQQWKMKEWKKKYQPLPPPDDSNDNDESWSGNSAVVRYAEFSSNISPNALRLPVRPVFKNSSSIWHPDWSIVVVVTAVVVAAVEDAFIDAITFILSCDSVMFVIPEVDGCCCCCWSPIRY